MQQLRNYQLTIFILFVSTGDLFEDVFHSQYPSNRKTCNSLEIDILNPHFFLHFFLRVIWDSDELIKRFCRKEVFWNLTSAYLLKCLFLVQMLALGLQRLEKRSSSQVLSRIFKNFTKFLWFIAYCNNTYWAGTY